jgi:hypothetical protein
MIFSEAKNPIKLENVFSSVGAWGFFATDENFQKMNFRQ